MRSTIISLLLFLSLAMSPLTVRSQSQVPVYTNNFEQSTGTQWSKKPLTTTPVGGRRFLGRFASESVTLLLTNLPAHNMLRVEFDLYIMGSWDGSTPKGDPCGPDMFELIEAQTNQILSTTFANHEYVDVASNGVPTVVRRMQAYPGTFPQDSYPWSTGCREADSLGYYWKWSRSVTPRYNGDCVYHFVKTFLHSDAVLDLSFAKLSPPDAGGCSNGIDDESWGLDNVSVDALTLAPRLPPIIVEQPQNINLSKDGDGTAFTVSAASVEPMTYQWYHGGTPIAGATNSFCVIPHLTIDSIGDYRVLIANLHGIALSEVALISVEPPIVLTLPNDATRRVSAANVTFSVVAVGAGQLGYQWYHNGLPLTNSARISGVESTVLTIGSGIQEADAGEYQIVITNFANMTNSASATLTVLPPLPPTVDLGKAVKLMFSSLRIGVKYQLQGSADMSTWTNQGSPFTATNSTMVYPEYLDVDNWGKLFFRLQTSP